MWKYCWMVGPVALIMISFMLFSPQSTPSTMPKPAAAHNRVSRSGADTTAFSSRDEATPATTTNEAVDGLVTTTSEVSMRADIEDATDKSKDWSKGALEATQQQLDEFMVESKKKFICNWDLEMTRRQVETATSSTIQMERDLGPKGWLTHKQVHQFAKSNLVIVTWANSHMGDFVSNWIENMDHLGITNFMVGAMDDELYKKLQHTPHHKQVFRMPADEELQDHKDTFWGWGSKLFNKMGRQKGLLVRTFLAMGVQLVLCDVDTVWLRDPLPFIQVYPLPDLMSSNDILAPSPGGLDGGLEDPLYGVGSLPYSQLMMPRNNIGVMLFRPTAAMRMFVEQWLIEMDRRPSDWDQTIFNNLVITGFRFNNQQTERNSKRGVRVGDMQPDLTGLRLPHQYEDRSVDVWCGLVRMGVLPITTFANGHGFFVQRLHEKFNMQPFIVHNTYQYFGGTGKRYRFREAKLWHLDSDAYFDPPGHRSPWAHLPYQASDGMSDGSPAGRFLALDLQVPTEMLNTIDSMVPQHSSTVFPIHHLQLIQYQLYQVAAGLALAWALDRVLVLPPFQCSCDHTFMVAWNCSYWPNALNRPFACPIDHVISLETWVSRHVPFRETSFLQNPRLPPTVLESEVTVILEADITVAAARKKNKQQQAKGGRRAVLPSQATDADVRAALTPFHDARLLRFSSLDRVFTGFADPQNQRASKPLFGDEMAFDWCCSPNGKVKYNFNPTCVSGYVDLVDSPNRRLVCREPPVGKFLPIAPI